MDDNGGEKRKTNEGETAKPQDNEQKEMEQIELPGSEAEEKEETKGNEEWYTPRENQPTLETDAERASKNADKLTQQWNDQKGNTVAATPELRISDLESEEELPSPHQGKFTYDPKPPSDQWLEIEKNWNEKQKIATENFRNAAIRLKEWEEQMEKGTQEHLKRAQEKQAQQDPNQPTSWWYIPPHPPKETEETEQETEQETKGKNEGEEGKGGDVQPDLTLEEVWKRRYNKEPIQPEGYQYKKEDFLVTATEYNPWMRVHTTNHCECRPRVTTQDPTLDWKNCPGFQHFLQEKYNQEQQHNQEEKPMEKGIGRKTLTPIRNRLAHKKQWNAKTNLTE